MSEARQREFERGPGLLKTGTRGSWDVFVLPAVRRRAETAERVRLHCEKGSTEAVLVLCGTVRRVCVGIQWNYGVKKWKKHVFWMSLVKVVLVLVLAF